MEFYLCKKMQEDDCTLCTAISGGDFKDSPRVQGDQVRMVLAIYVFPNIHTAMNAFCPKKGL